MPLNKDIIEVYKKLYDLPVLVHREAVDFEFFGLCKEDYKFVVIAIYNERRELLLLRDFNKNIGWELVGGYIKKEEKIEEGVNRIILKETGLTIDELQPIAIINNNFEWNNRTISHLGIAFIALARGLIKVQPENIKIIFTRDMPERMAYQNKEILKRVKQIIEDKSFEPPYKEIEAGNKYFLFYFINKYFIKLIGNFSSKKIQEKMMELIIGNPRFVIDVSGGDDNFIFRIEKKYKPELCVVNDISWKTLSLLRNKNRKSGVLLTNHNVLDLPFKKKFDLMIFKNTLHHISPIDRGDLIKKLLNCSKQLIIVDVEDPNRSNFLSKLWHWYYVYLLGDQGNYFLSFNEFKKNIEENIRDKKVDFGVINTIKGRYFYCSLSEITPTEEVEIKIKIKPSQVKKIKERLINLGAIYKEKIKEADTYFTAPHRDFVKTKECLRIREKDGHLELTYKGPTTRLMNNKKQFWKSEINIPLYSSKKEVEDFLRILNFRKIIDVVKEREKFILGKQEITIDNVKKAGWFLEIENNINNKKDRKKALEENINLVRELGLKEQNIINEPYRDIVLKNNK